MNVLGTPGGEGNECWEDIKDIPQDIIDGMGYGEEYDAMKEGLSSVGDYFQEEYIDPALEGLTDFQDWYQSGDTAEQWENVKDACEGMGSTSFDPDACIGQLDTIPREIIDDVLSALGIEEEMDIAADLFSDWYHSGAVNKNWEEVKDACEDMGNPNFDPEACFGQIAEIPYSVLESIGLNDEYDALSNVVNKGLDWTEGKLNEAGEWIEGAYNEAGEFLYDTAGDIWEAGEGVVEDVGEYIEEDLLEDLEELGEAALNSACVTAAASGCTADATANTSWGSGYGKRWQTRYNNCIKHWCG